MMRYYAQIRQLFDIINLCNIFLLLLDFKLRSFTPAAGVQIPLGTPINKFKELHKYVAPFFSHLPTPNTIPNRSDRNQGKKIIIRADKKPCFQQMKTGFFDLWVPFIEAFLK